MSTAPRLAPIADADPAHVEALLDASFGADRHGRTAYRLRDGAAAIPALSFAAFAGDALVGTIQCWPVALEDAGGETAPMVLVGPVAVAPDRQGAGIGRALVEATLAAADATGAPVLMMIGDPDYYGRFFGFSATGTEGWAMPGPVERHRLLRRGGGVPAARRVVPRG